MELIAPDVYRLPITPRAVVNAYLIEDVLIDAGLAFSAKNILKQIDNRKLSAHVLTHAHIDHVGSSHCLCETLNIPLWCGEADKAAVESGKLADQSPPNLISKWQKVAGHPVSRILKEGDEVGGFSVLETPGHTLGHLAFWRERDGVLILGDVLLNLNFITFGQGLREPIRAFTLDPALNRDSARKLANLNPRIVCFGHGNPLLDGAKMVEFVRKLPQ